MTERAGVYGGSLYDLAAEEGLTASVKEQMLQIRDIFRENPDYLKLLNEPAIKKTERTKLIDEAFGDGIELYLKNFLKLLCEKGIFNEYEGCLEEFIKRFNADNNICDAYVTSAVSLNDGQLKALKAKLEASTKKTVNIISKVDASVLAGIKVEIEGKQLDGTVATRMSDISASINNTII